MDKKMRYIWAVNLLVNAVMYLVFVQYEIREGYYGIRPWVKDLTSPANGWFSPFAVAVFFFSALGIFLSGRDFKGKKYFGTVILPLLIVWGVWEIKTCHGFVCGIPGFLVATGSSLLLVFFVVNSFLRKQSIRVSVAFLWIEVVAITILLFLNVCTLSWRNEAGMRENVCTILPSNIGEGYCWYGAIRLASYRNAVSMCDGFEDSHRSLCLKAKDKWMQSLSPEEIRSMGRSMRR